MGATKEVVCAARSRDIEGESHAQEDVMVAGAIGIVVLIILVIVLLRIL
jgi:hypothetical protein